MFKGEIMDNLKSGDRGEPITILFIEDGPAHAEIKNRNFKKNRIWNNVIHLSDGHQTLDYLFHQGTYSDEKAGPLPYLILMDLRLPKVDGLEVLEKIHGNQELKCIPTVILTTSGADRTFGFYWVVWNRYNPCR